MEMADSQRRTSAMMGLGRLMGHRFPDPGPPSCPRLLANSAAGADPRWPHSSACTDPCLPQPIELSQGVRAHLHHLDEEHASGRIVPPSCAILCTKITAIPWQASSERSSTVPCRTHQRAAVDLQQAALDVMVGMSGAVEAGGETGWRGHHKRNGDGLGQGVGAQ